jgi:hypothetical protein
LCSYFTRRTHFDCGLILWDKLAYTLTPEARRARQLNAQHSTGPRTKEGKEKSAKNGVNWKHGQYSKSIIRKTLGVCNDKCGKYPCSAVSKEETTKGDLCMDNEGLPTKIKTMIDAVDSGDGASKECMRSFHIIICKELGEN